MGDNGVRSGSHPPREGAAQIQITWAARERAGRYKDWEFGLVKREPRSNWSDSIGKDLLVFKVGKAAHARLA